MSARHLDAMTRETFIAEIQEEYSAAWAELKSNTAAAAAAGTPYPAQLVSMTGNGITRNLERRWSEAENYPARPSVAAVETPKEQEQKK